MDVGSGLLPRFVYNDSWLGHCGQRSSCYNENHKIKITHSGRKATSHLSSCPPPATKPPLPLPSQLPLMGLRHLRIPRIHQFAMLRKKLNPRKQIVKYLSNYYDQLLAICLQLQWTLTKDCCGFLVSVMADIWSGRRQGVLWTRRGHTSSLGRERGRVGVHIKVFPFRRQYN